jgi:hypothetical protein
VSSVPRQALDSVKFRSIRSDFARCRILFAPLRKESIASYDEPVQLQCLDRPKNSTCKFSEAIVTPTSKGVTTKVHHHDQSQSHIL